MRTPGGRKYLGATSEADRLFECWRATDSEDGWNAYRAAAEAASVELRKVQI